MTVKKFIDEVVRPLAGDTYALVKDANVNTPQGSIPTSQVVKYPEQVLLDMLNEGIQDISEHSKLFEYKAIAIIREGDKEIKVPDDFKGFYESKDAQIGLAYDGDSRLSDIKIIPTRNGVSIKDPVTKSMISRYKEVVQGVSLPTELIDLLVKSGQIDVPANSLMVDLGEVILLHYSYLALPKEMEITDTIDDRELRNTLKWFVASYAVDLDMHNEASNLASRYWSKYLRRLEKVGTSRTNWNAVSLSPYLPRSG